MPSLDHLRSRASSARPADPRIDSVLSSAEDALRAEGLVVMHVGMRGWAIELDVGDGHGSGSLLIHARGSGVLSSPKWNRLAPEDVRARVDRVFLRLANV